MLEFSKLSQIEITDIISFLLSPPFSEYFLLMKIIFFLSSLFFLILIIYFLIHSTYLQLSYADTIMDFFTKKTYAGKTMSKAWQEIKDKLKSREESDYKLAVIEADGLLDEVLRRIGYRGETLDDKLEKLTSVHLPNILEVKKAHQVRASIVRDPDYFLSLEEARKAMDIYEKTLKDLEVF